MDIVVTDEEITSVSQSIKKFGNEADDIFARYLSCMKRLAEKGFVQGETSDTIKSFVSSISALKGDIGVITGCVKQEGENYISDLDRADDFLY